VCKAENGKLGELKLHDEDDGVLESNESTERRFLVDASLAT